MASVLTSSVLASPGTPSSRQWPRLKSADQELLDHLVLADDHARELVEDAVVGLVQAVDGGGRGWRA